MPSYITPAEYRAAPTAVDTNNLVAGGNQAVQDGALLGVIARASAWIDNLVTFSMIASSYVEWVPTRYQRDGTLSLHPKRTPLNQLVGLSLGTHAANMAAVTDLTGAWVNEQQWVVPNTAAFSLVGLPVQFGSGRGTVLAKLTAIGGWPNTTIVGAPAQGATVITVAQAAGFSPAVGSIPFDQSIIIWDGASTETVAVASVAGSVLTVAATQFAHAAGTVISGLPGDIKEAAILATTGFITRRQADTIVAGNLAPQPAQMQPANPGGSRALYDARMMLHDFGRIR